MVLSLSRVGLGRRRPVFLSTHSRRASSHSLSRSLRTFAMVLEMAVAAAIVTAIITDEGILSFEVDISFYFFTGRVAWGVGWRRCR